MASSSNHTGKNFIKPPLAKNEACLTCKSRKVKCGAQKPRCHTCVRYALSKNQDPGSFVCEYPEPPPQSPSKKSTHSRRGSVIKNEDGAGGNESGKEEREERIKKMEQKLWELERLILMQEAQFGLLTSSNPNPNPIPQQPQIPNITHRHTISASTIRNSSEVHNHASYSDPLAIYNNNHQVLDDLLNGSFSAYPYQQQQQHLQPHQHESPTSSTNGSFSSNSSNLSSSSNSSASSTSSSLPLVDLSNDSTYANLNQFGFLTDYNNLFSNSYQANQNNQLQNGLDNYDAFRFSNEMLSPSSLIPGIGFFENPEVNVNFTAPKGKAEKTWSWS